MTKAGDGGRRFSSLQGLCKFYAASRRLVNALGEAPCSLARDQARSRVITCNHASLHVGHALSALWDNVKLLR